jgi:hypothetical protein
MNGWIGVDLDGTLAHYNGWVDELHIGDPVPLMVERVKDWLKQGTAVRIFTARVAVYSGRDRYAVVRAIQDWCALHIGEILPVTNEKDFGMVALYDDRAIQVRTNTGELVG